VGLDKPQKDLDEPERTGQPEVAGLD
jgi:hypothetical protein